MGKKQVDAVWFWLWSSRAAGPSVAALIKRALQLRSLQPFLRSAHFLLASPLIQPHLSALSKPPLHHPPHRSLSFLYAANVIHGSCSSRDLLRQRKQGIFTDQSDGVELCTLLHTHRYSSITARTRGSDTDVCTGRLFSHESQYAKTA